MQPNLGEYLVTIGIVYTHVVQRLIAALLFTSNRKGNHCFDYIYSDRACQDVLKYMERTTDSIFRVSKR